MVSDDLRLALCKRPNRHGVSLSSPEDGKDPVSSALCFQVIQNSRQWTKSRNSVILVITVAS
jgi:hypothetical protein